MRDERRVFELLCRNIEVDAKAGRQGADARQITHDSIEDPARERCDQTRALGEVDELIRAQPAAHGMIPAHESLGADDRTRR